MKAQLRASLCSYRNDSWPASTGRNTKYLLWRPAHTDEIEAMFWKLLVTDLKRARFFIEEGRPSFLLRLIMLPLFQRPRVLFLLRLAVDGPRWTHGISRLLLRALHSIEIGKQVRIGSGVLLPHPQSIVIGQGVTIGNEVSIGQFVTIGGNYRKTRDRNGFIQRLPILGSRVMIGPGAVIGGPVIIGDDVVIGANAVITKDVPANHLAYGLSQLSRRRIIVDPTGSYSYIDIEDRA